MNDGGSTPPRTGSMPPRGRPQSAAERVRLHRYRARKRIGRFTINVPLEIVELLYDEGLLPAGYEVDEAALSAVVARGLRVLLGQKNV